MKFFVRLSVLLSLTLLLTACGSVEKDHDNTPIPGTVNTPDQPDEGIRYELTSEIDADNGIQIKYPTITGLKDSAKQAQLNELIHKHARFAADLYKDSEQPAHVDINFEVKLQNKKILSVAYFGTGNVETAAHPNRLFYTTNLDLTTGTLLRLQDAVKIDADFVKLFRQGTYADQEQTANEELKDAVLQWVSEKTDEELLTMLASSDFAGAYDPTSPPEVFSYYTQDGLGISIPVPHPLGDHAEIEIQTAWRQ